MEPIKVEENIREKLQQRELQPSKEAWNKLAVSLAKEPKKKKNTIVWMAVAASLVGILLAVSFLFGSKEPNKIKQLVKEDTVPKVEETENLRIIPIIDERTKNVAEIDNFKEDEPSSEENFRKDNIKQTVANANTNAKEKQKLENLTPNPKELIAVTLNNKIDEEIAANPTKNEKIPTIEKPIKTNNAIFITAKVEEVVATVQQIQKENNTVTLDEIDALLRKAQRDISNNRILNSSTLKVDATALLLDVESELERSFRNKVFDALGEGFNKVRTAVAERNN